MKLRLAAVIEIDDDPDPDKMSRLVDDINDAFGTMLAKIQNYRGKGPRRYVPVQGVWKCDCRDGYFCTQCRRIFGAEVNTDLEGFCHTDCPECGPFSA